MTEKFASDRQKWDYLHPDFKKHMGYKDAGYACKIAGKSPDGADLYAVFRPGYHIIAYSVSTDREIAWAKGIELLKSEGVDLYDGD